MRLSFLAALTASICLAACGIAPTSPLFTPTGSFTATPGTKIGIVMVVLPKITTEFPGAACTDCMAAAATTHLSLTNHMQPLTAEDLTQAKVEIARLLEAKGMQVRVMDAALDLGQLPAFTGRQPASALRDFRGLKASHGVDKLAVIEVTSLGVRRAYADYRPLRDPEGVLTGAAYVVNLSDNTLESYQPVEAVVQVERDWDDSPHFPALTRSYFDALALGKTALIKPFQ
ncbi:hypothetical protein [Ideonella sp.]|uniref:hypothetical protein n=1 Tax=Ideonella sp. TaxID=1929293 RepID=UPI002C2E3021|nr:hypothetical protein [Ramlibacter sp.]